MFSRPLAFSTIPKACGFEAATRFTSNLLGGSLIPIVVYRDGDGFPLAKHVPCESGNPLKPLRSWIPAFAGMTARIGQFESINILD